jgi:hypothetical protein
MKQMPKNSFAERRQKRRKNGGKKFCSVSPFSLHSDLSSQLSIEIQKRHKIQFSAFSRRFKFSSPWGLYCKTFTALI